MKEIAEMVEMRIINYIIMNVHAIIMYSHKNDVDNDVLCFLKKLQNEKHIAAFSLKVTGNAITIKVPGMFIMEVDRSDRTFSIEMYGHIENCCVEFSTGLCMEPEPKQEYVVFSHISGAPLIENRDYIVDRTQGSITITEHGMYKRPDHIRVSYDNTYRYK